MANATIGLPDELQAYIRQVGVREAPILARLREETASLPMHDMQIAPEEGALLGLLAQLTGAKRCIEIGTFTGYSSLAVALALPADARIVCCDVSEEWTAVARRYWAEAGVADRIDLRLGPAIETLDGLLADGGANTYDFAFIDAAKNEYPDYYDRLIQLIRPGGLIAIDNVFQSGAVVDPAKDGAGVTAVRALNEQIHADERVSVAIVPIADGLTLARKR